MHDFIFTNKIFSESNDQGLLKEKHVILYTYTLYIYVYIYGNVVQICVLSIITNKNIVTWLY